MPLGPGQINEVTEFGGEDSEGWGGSQEGGTLTPTSTTSVTSSILRYGQLLFFHLVSSAV